MVWHCTPGSYPQQSDVVPEGAAEIASPPTYDPATQILGWRGTEWHVEAIPAAELLDGAKRRLRGAVQAYVDRVARVRDYNDGNSCASYAASTVEAWRDEAQAFVAWRDAVWSYVINSVMDAVANGQRGVPSEQDLLAELDDPPWPVPRAT